MRNVNLTNSNLTFGLEDSFILTMRNVNGFIHKPLLLKLYCFILTMRNVNRELILIPKCEKPVLY